MAVEADSPHRSLETCQSVDDYKPDRDRMKRRVQTLSYGLTEVTLSSNAQVVQFIHESFSPCSSQWPSQIIDWIFPS